MKGISEALPLGILRLLQDLGLGPRWIRATSLTFLRMLDSAGDCLVFFTGPRETTESQEGDVIEFRGGREGGREARLW